jgi:hypothetical protein
LPSEWQLENERMVLPIEQRDAALDLRSTSARAHDRFAELDAHNSISLPPRLLRLLPAGANRRVGLAPTGERRVITAHAINGHWVYT